MVDSIMILSSLKVFLLDILNITIRVQTLWIDSLKWFNHYEADAGYSCVKSNFISLMLDPRKLQFDSRGGWISDEKDAGGS